tara:strand:- start:133 stop:1041 length:909 start_codon:yes stop_codon:yes gene_type:complete
MTNLDMPAHKLVRNALLGKRFLEIIQDAIPRGSELDAVRLAWVTITYCETPNDRGQTPLLSVDVNSLQRAMLQCAEVGLEPSVGGACWIIPRGGKATFQMGALGYIELAMRAGARRCWADVVYEADGFSIKRGDAPGLDHELTNSWHLPGRNLDFDHRRLISIEEGGAGKALGAYACVELEDGTVIWSAMSESELSMARASSKSKDSPAYKNWPDQMRIRSAIARASKLWPKKMKIVVSEDNASPAMLERLQAIETEAAKSLPEAKPQGGLDAILEENTPQEPPKLEGPEADFDDVDMMQDG